MLQERGGSRPQAQPHQSQLGAWERFCREEAREAASAFLERVRRFKTRHASARDVHDSTFTNEFSAAFLEESSVLMASEGETILPTTSGAFTTSLPAERIGANRQKGTKSGSGKSWWSGLFKWKSKSRERHSSGSSTSSNTAGSGPTQLTTVGSTKQKKRRGIRVVKETSVVQLLNLSSECEDSDDMNWSACKLMLVEQQENYQLEIYSPPRNPMPKMSLFCFLIDEVRSTSLLETPDSNSCFAVKSQNHGEYVFDVGSVGLKEEWVRVLQVYTHKVPVNNGHLPRSTVTSSHLATLPRAPSQNSSPARGLHPGGPPNRGGSRQSSPLLTRRTHQDISPSRPPVSVAVGGSSRGNVETGEHAPRHLSMSDPRKTAVANTTMQPGDSEESVLVDMSSFMRNYSQTRSPNRQRKTMSMFIDSSTHPQFNPYVQPTPPINVVTSSPSSSPSHPVATGPAESPARFPYASPRDSPPPPLPRRGGSRPRSMFVKNVVNSNSTGVSGVSPLSQPGGNLPHPRHPATQKALPMRPDEAHPLPSIPSETTPLSPVSTEARPFPTSPNEIAQSPATPTVSRPLPVIPSEAVPHQATPRPLPATPSEATSHPATPTGNRLSLLGEASVRPKESTVLSNAPKLIPFASNNSKSEHSPPRRKFSQPSLELPSSPHAITRRGSTSTCEPPSPGMLESSENCASSSALHPISIAALSKPRKNSIPLTPTEDCCRSAQLAAGAQSSVGNSVRLKERTRKISAPSLAQGDSKGEHPRILAPTNPVSKRSDSKRSLEVDILEAEGENEDIESDGKACGVVATSSADHTLASPTNCFSRGFCEGEERSDHATLSFPFFSQRSSPPQQQVSPRTRTASELAVEESQDQPPPLPPPISTEHLNGLFSSNDPHPPVGTALQEEPSHTPPPSRERAGSRSSNQTSRSIHSTSSMEDRDNSLRAESSTSNPIFVETTEGQEYNQAAVHTRHPYEYWATNQQDITNLRTLSQYPWFHGMISRNNASQLVVANGDRGTGQYLVRQSESREGDFVLTFNYHNKAKHLRMAVDDSGCNIQHLWFEGVPAMLDYFKVNSIPLESFWLNDDVKLTTYIDRQASDAFRTTTVLNVDQLNRVPPRRSRSLHLGMSHAVASGSSHPTTPVSIGPEQRGSSSASASTNSLQSSASSGWRQIFRSQRSSSAGNVGRVQRSHSHNAGSIQATGRGGGGAAAGGTAQRSNAYVWRNY